MQLLQVSLFLFTPRFGRWRLWPKHCSNPITSNRWIEEHNEKGISCSILKTSEPKIVASMGLPICKRCVYRAFSGIALPSEVSLCICNVRGNSGNMDSTLSSSWHWSERHIRSYGSFCGKYFFRASYKWKKVGNCRRVSLHASVNQHRWRIMIYCTAFHILRLQSCFQLAGTNSSRRIAMTGGGRCVRITFVITCWWSRAGNTSVALLARLFLRIFTDAHSRFERTSQYW